MSEHPHGDGSACPECGTELMDFGKQKGARATRRAKPWWCWRCERWFSRGEVRTANERGED